MSFQKVNRDLQYLAGYLAYLPADEAILRLLFCTCGHG